MYRIIAMIPARMGSKRVPKKNARLMCGKSLLQYAIDTAKEADCFDEIWLNTESELLGTIVYTCGISLHKRPVELASDTATNQDFTSEFLQKHPCDYIIMLNPTSPLLRSDTIRLFYNYVKQGNFDTVLSVIEEKAECFFNGKPINFSRKIKINSQDLEPIQKVVWALTAWRREHFLDVAKLGGCSVFSGKLGTFPIPLMESIDIDTQEDWDLAENILKHQKQQEIQKPKPAIYWGGVDYGE